jgi:hypothetical protein
MPEAAGYTFVSVYFMYLPVFFDIPYHILSFLC